MNNRTIEFPALFEADRVMSASERYACILDVTKKAARAGYLCGDWQAVLDMTDTLSQVGELDRHCRLLRAKALIELGRSQDAISELVELAAKDPWCGNTQNLLGEARLYAKKYKEAIRAFSNCICLKPISSILRCETTSYVGRAMAFTFIGRAQAAALDMDTCIALRQMQKARVHYWSGRHTECTRLLKNLPTKVRMLPAGQYLSARNRIAAGDFVQALNEISKALSSSHVALPLLHCRAICNYQTGNFEGCITDLSKIINLAGRIVLLEVNPVAEEVEMLDISQLFDMRANCYRQLGNYSAAIEDYERVVDLNPTAATYFARAQTLYRLGLVVRALSDLERAEEAMASDVDFLSLKMLCYSRLNRASEAAHLARLIIEKDPKHDIAIKTLRLVEQPENIAIYAPAEFAQSTIQL